MTDTIEGEILYQEFIAFRDRFLTNALEDAVTCGTNIYGQKFRPIVIVPEKQAAKWQKLIKVWQGYAEKLREFPQLGLTKSLFDAEPKYILGATRIHSNIVAATNVSTVSRDRVMNEITTMIQRVGISEDTKSYISNLQNQLEILQALPSDAKLRIRRGGYEDLVCTYNTVTEKKLMVRVNSGGVFFDERALRGGYHVGRSTGTGRVSVYDKIPELPITIYKGGKVYLLSDIEAFKEQYQAERAANESERKREQWNRANQKRRAIKVKEETMVEGAANGPGETNPAGGGLE